MPVYEYQCTECGRVEETFQKISDAPLQSCSHCHGKLKKLISQSAFHLKGSGWYVTDYGGSKNSSKQSTDKDSTSKKSENKTASAKQNTNSKD